MSASDQARVVGVDLSGRTVGRTAIATLAGTQFQAPTVVEVRAERKLRDDNQLVETTVEGRPTVVSLDAPLALPHAVVCNEPDCPRCLQTNGTVPPVAMRAAENAVAWKQAGHKERPPMPFAMLAGVAFRGIYVARLLRRHGFDVIETWPMGVDRRLQRPADDGVDGSDDWRKAVIGRFVQRLESLDELQLNRDVLDAIAAG